MLELVLYTVMLLPAHLEHVAAAKACHIEAVDELVGCKWCTASCSADSHHGAVLINLWSDISRLPHTSDEHCWCWCPALLCCLAWGNDVHC